jgi:glycopeptide antibiotics resistance protein
MLRIDFTVFLIAAIISYAAFKLIDLKKKRRRIFARELFSAVFFSYFLIMIYFSFFPLLISFEAHPTANIVPILETIKFIEDAPAELVMSNIVRNILIFVPFGFFMPMLFRRAERFYRTVAYGVLASFAIESVQFLLRLRIANVDHIILNTAGVIAGYLIYKLFKLLFILLGLNTEIYILQDKSKKSLFSVSLKLIGPMLVLTAIPCFIMFFKQTYSVRMSGEELVRKSLKGTKVQVAAEEKIGNNKLILTVEERDNQRFLRLEVFSRALAIRYYHRYSSQLQLERSESGFHFNGVPSAKGTENVIVFGKNKIAARLSISYKGEEYSEDISEKTYFIVCYPQEIPIGYYKDSLKFKLHSKSEEDITSAFYHKLN